MIKVRKRHELFDSVEEMVQIDALSELLARPITTIRRQSIDIDGSSRNDMERIYLNSSPDDTLRMKRISRDTDWLMHSTDDLNCRSVTLWQDGVLDELLPHLDHTVLACARDGDGWAILMRDETDRLIGDEMSKKQIYRLLDAQAAMHARFWQCDELKDSDLCDTFAFLDGVSYAKALEIEGIPSNLPSYIIWGWDHLDRLLLREVLDQLLQLRDNPRPLHDALAHLPHTLAHGDYRADNVAIDWEGTTSPAVFDWQLAGYTPMTVDLAWFINNSFGQIFMPPNEAAIYYRRRLERYLGWAFDDQLWRKMLDLGMLANALRSICFDAYFAFNGNDAYWRGKFRAAFGRYNDIILNGVRWL